MYCTFSRLTGDDGSTCVPIISDNVEIVASQDSSINSKARGSNKVKSSAMKCCCSLSVENQHWLGDLQQQQRKTVM